MPAGLSLHFSPQVRSSTGRESHYSGHDFVNVVPCWLAQEVVEIKFMTLVAVALLVATGCDRVGERAAQAPAPTQPPASPGQEIDQVEWKITAFPAGALDRVSKKERKRLKSQRARLRLLVRNLYDTLFLDPGSRRATVGRLFATRAARALLRSNAGLSSRVTRVKTLIRRAEIGIQAKYATRAAAHVQVRARGFVEDNRVTIRHRAKLWLERTKNRWTVIAFEIDQRPVG
jgi:hypothetical protein